MTPSTLLGPFCGAGGWPPTGGRQDTPSSRSAAPGEHVLSSAGSVLGMGQLLGRTCPLGALLATGKCFPGRIVASPPPGAVLLPCWVFPVLAEGWDSSGRWHLCKGHVGVPCWEVFIQTRCPVLWRLSFLPHYLKFFTYSAPRPVLDACVVNFSLRWPCCLAVLRVSSDK